MVSQVSPALESLTDAQLQRRDRIVDAAVELLMTLPYDKIQMRDVAGDAGVALGTLYRYFSSKEHLFAAALLNWVNRLDERVHRKQLRGTTNCERLVEIFLRAARSFQVAPQFFDAWLAIGSSSDPRAKEITAVAGERTNAIYLQALDGIDADRGATIILCCQALMNWLLHEWHAGTRTIDDVYVELQKGIKLLMEGSTDY